MKLRYNIREHLNFPEFRIFDFSRQASEQKHTADVILSCLYFSTAFNGTKTLKFVLKESTYILTYFTMF